MKSKKINVKTIVIIILIGIIIGVVILNLNDKNINMTKQEISKEQLEATSDNAYVSMETHLSEVNDATKVDESIAATADNITEGKQAWVNGKLITGKAIANNNFNVDNLQIISAQSTSPYTFTSDGLAILGLNYTINSGAYKNVYFKLNDEYLNENPVKVYSVGNTLSFCIEVKSGDVLKWGQTQYAGSTITGNVSLAKSYLIPKN